MTEAALRIQRYLKQYLEIKEDLYALELELQELTAIAERIVPSAPRERSVPKKRGQSPIEHTLFEIDQCRDYLILHLRGARRTLSAIRKLINTLPADKRYRNVLTLRYIRGMRYDAIADELNLDPRWITRLHASALERLAQMHPDITL